MTSFISYQCNYFFIIDDQQSVTISVFLIQIKKYLENNISKSKKPLPNVVVTDQSFAIINSLTETFNNCTISQYLEWSFNLVFEKCKNSFSNTSMPVSLYLCATHFLKNIVIKTNETLKLKKSFKSLDKETLIKVKVKELFIRGFTLLQNSVKIVDFNADLQDLCYIFISKTKDNKFKVSYERISKHIYLRDHFVMFDASKEDEEMIRNLDEFKFISPETHTGIRSNSKFETYYNKFISNIEESININIDPVAETNEFHCPELIKILKDRLYIMPLWSGVVVFRNGPVGNYETRLTNNPSEVSFSHKRNSILKICKNSKIKRRVMPSEYIAFTYSRLLSKYLQFYSSISKEPSIKSPVSNEREKWASTPTNAKKDSYFYRSNLSFLLSSNQDSEHKGIFFTFLLKF